MTTEEFTSKVRDRILFLADEPEIEREAWIVAANEVNLVQRFAAMRPDVEAGYGENEEAGT